MYGDALTTKERIKERLGIDVTTWDDFFDRLIQSVTARIEQTCGRRFIQATYRNEIHDGCDMYGTSRRMLIVKNAPLHSVDSVEYNTGTNSSPVWTEISVDYYDIDLEAGILHFPEGLPHGRRNIRITYTGGFSGYSIGVNNFWVFNVVPTGTVNGSNRTFTLPETASQVIVYADGVREASSNVTFTEGTNTFTLAVGRAPTSTIAVDYLKAVETSEAEYYLPADLVEVCEEAVVRIFKRRDSEGRTSETFAESSISWMKSVFTEEDLATIGNYRRGYFL